MANAQKLVARAAMHRLENAGMENVLNAPSGNRVFFYLAKHSPEALETVVAAAEKSTGIEREVWYSILCKSSPIMWGEGIERYLQLEALIPLAIQLEESERPNSAKSTASTLLRQAFRNFQSYGNNVDILRAAVIVLHLKKAHLAFSRMKDPEIKLLSPDVEFISKHVEGVLEILPILRHRKTTEPGIVSALLDAKTAAVSAGVL